MSPPLVLGLTGKSCAGKDLAARTLAHRGWHIIDLDREGHQALEENPGAIAAAFGKEVLLSDGRVDRRALGRIVFSDPEALARLEGIVHPLMVTSVKKQVDAFSGDAPRGVVINGALVERMGLVSHCDVLLVITAPLIIRLFRAMRRDRIPLSSALRRFSSQKDVGRRRNIGAKSVRKSVDTYYICNLSGQAALEKRVAGFEEALVKRRSRQE